VDAFLWLQAAPGAAGRVVGEVSTLHGVRRATLVVGDWDGLAVIEADDMPAIGAILGQVQAIEGVVRTAAAPMVPPDRLGTVGGGFTIGRPPQLNPGDACYVQIRATPGSVPVLFERLAEIEAVTGVAAIAGAYDLLVEIRRPWDVASGLILELIRPLEGVIETSTLVGYEEAEEDRDQFSAWS
jgi:DNA-binding Lrp family transcriptional regulator